MQKTKTGLYIIHEGTKVYVYTEKELKRYFKPTLKTRITRWFEKQLDL